jgi:pimeloyl-ACP methyl ester carboxylesterase
LTIGQLTTAVTDHGAGRVVLLLHGNPDYREGWHTVIDQLEDGYRCVAADLPGFGDAGPPPASFDFGPQAFAGFVDGLLRELAIPEPVVLVAHDVGAVPALAWAAVNPDRTVGMVVANTVFHPDYHWHTMARLWRTPAVGELFMMVMNQAAFRRAISKEAPKAAPSEPDRMYAKLDRTTRATILRWYRRMTRPDYLGDWLERMTAIARTVPTRVVWGRRDRLIPDRYAYRIGEHVTWLDEVGHWVPLEAPDAIANAVRDLTKPLTWNPTDAPG